ncbi:unnamed protein product, partial [Staurois parvus]
MTQQITGKCSCRDSVRKVLSEYLSEDGSAPIIRALMISALMISAQQWKCKCRFSAALFSRCQIVRKVLPRTGS